MMVVGVMITVIIDNMNNWEIQGNRTNIVIIKRYHYKPHK